MVERVERLIKALLCKIEAYIAKVESIEDCCNGNDQKYVNKGGDSMQGLLELEAGVDFNDLDSGYKGHLGTEDLDDDVVWVFPNASGTVALTSDLFSCIDLVGCPEIAEIINSIPTDVSDLSDSGGVLLGYKGEQSSAPLSPQKGWFYKNTDDGVMYYFDGTNWIAYAEIGSTSLFDDIFIYNLSDNPDQEFELSFLPYQIVFTLDNNQMKWLDDGDYEVNGQTLKMLYPLENETKLRINYYHNL